MSDDVWKALPFDALCAYVVGLQEEVAASQRKLEAHEKWNHDIDAAWMRKLEAVEARADAAEKANERLRHGQPIEGDYVCPNELRAASMEEALRWYADEERYAHYDMPSLHDDCGERARAALKK